MSGGGVYPCGWCECISFGRSKGQLVLRGRGICLQFLMWVEFSEIKIKCSKFPCIPGQ